MFSFENSSPHPLQPAGERKPTDVQISETEKEDKLENVREVKRHRGLFLGKVRGGENPENGMQPHMNEKWWIRAGGRVCGQQNVEQIREYGSTEI